MIDIHYSQDTADLYYYNYLYGTFIYVKLVIAVLIQGNLISSVFLRRK